MRFISEEIMSSKIYKILLDEINNHKNVKILKEFDGIISIPDFLLIIEDKNANPYLISIELKLKNWKIALHQAFRYKAFCNEAYVIIDSTSISRVSNNLNDFRKANIGVATFDTELNIKIYNETVPSLPYSKYYSNKFLHKYYKHNEVSKEEKNDNIFRSENSNNLEYSFVKILRNYSKLSYVI